MPKRTLLCISLAVMSLLSATAVPGGQPAPRSALALEDRARDVRLVDDEREHRPIAPTAEEEMAVDVDSGVGQPA